MKSHFNYLPFDKYILRTPILPFSEVIDLTVERIKELCENEFVSEAIYVASPELHREMEKYLKSSKTNERLLFTLLKYITRMGCRATPFGLFSGISIGHVQNKTNIKLKKINQHKRYTRLDMNYLCALAKKLENIKEIQKGLLYYPNTSLYQMESEIRYVEYTYSKTERKHFLISIDSNVYIKKILKRALQGARIVEMANVIIDDEITLSDAIQFIHELIENQVLISSISPSVTGENYLELISKNIKKPSTNKWIDKIKGKLKEIDKSNSKNKINLYRDIQNLTNNFDIVKNDKYIIQSDLLINVKHNSINNSIMTDVIKGLKILNRLTNYEKNKDMEDFKERFYKRYEEEPIPLTLALDVDIGVGYGKVKRNYNNTSDLTSDLFITNQDETDNNIKLSAIDKILHEKVLECIKNDKTEIELTNLDLINFEENWEDLSNTFSVRTTVFESNSQNSLIHISNFGRVTAVSIFGRFCHIDKEIEQFAFQIAEKDEENNKITAEIAHLPETRTGNIIYRPHLRKYEIPYLAKSNLNIDQQISINDLYVTVRRSKVILYSKRLNKEVIPYLSNAHNHWSNTLPIYNFLSDLRSQDIREDLSFSWGEIFYNYEYLPRVSFENIILTLAQWVIKKEELSQLNSLEDILILREKKNMPALLLLIEGDNELFINFKNQISCNMFLKHVKNKDKVLLKEFLYNPNKPLVKQDLKPFVNEIIFSFHKDKQS